MKIRVSFDHKDKIEDALLAVNGLYSTHTITDYWQVSSLAREAEKRLETLGLPQRLRKGALYRVRSGAALPRSYRYPRRVTFITLSRGTKDWFLVRVEAGEAWREAQDPRLGLTREQDAYVRERLRSMYDVLEEKEK